jgi:carboxyl-terminal processing protease
VNLDEVVRNSKPELGDLKVTIAQFFRINGGTTQLHGVTPDISLPSFSDPARFGETSYDNALPWAQIKPATYKPIGTITALLPTLQRRHEARVESNPDFQRLLEDIADVEAQRNKGVVSLNEAERRRELTAREIRMKSRAQAGDGANAGEDDGLRANERSLSADIAIENARKNAKDVLLDEAAAILADEADLQEGVVKAATGQSENTEGK